MNFSMYTILRWNWVLGNTWSFWILISSTSLSAYCGSRAGSWIAFRVLVLWNHDSLSHFRPTTHISMVTVCLRDKAPSGWHWGLFSLHHSWKPTSNTRATPPHVPSPIGPPHPPIICLSSNSQRALFGRRTGAMSYSAFNLPGALFTMVSTNISSFRNMRNRNIVIMVEPSWHFLSQMTVAL